MISRTYKFIERTSSLSSLLLLQGEEDLLDLLHGHIWRNHATLQHLLDLQLLQEFWRQLVLLGVWLLAAIASAELLLLLLGLFLLQLLLQELQLHFFVLCLQLLLLLLLLSLLLSMLLCLLL